MYHAKYVIPGLCLFLLLVFLPSILGRGRMFTVALELPKDAKACIEDTAVMRDRHMQILDAWRTQVVRQGKHIYVNAKGKKYVMRLTDTCLGCHTKTGFCDRCHAVMDVNPTCWNCHNSSPDQPTAVPPRAAN